jgi:hypothetical protein
MGYTNIWLNIILGVSVIILKRVTFSNAQLFGRQKQEDTNLRPAQAKLVRLCLKNKIHINRVGLWVKW